jgi:hypothetical protein
LSKAAIAKLGGDKTRTQVSNLDPESVYPPRQDPEITQSCPPRR